MKTLRRALAAAAAFLPVVAHAQAPRCVIPGALPAPRPDLPTADQPQRRVAIGGYTLALTWSPQFCRTTRDPAARYQCASAKRFGFTLHGLWPDGEGMAWPQYCGAAQLLDRKTLSAAFCATPSVQLQQHEWAKHGTCMGTTPTDYFQKSGRLYGALHYPDMAALSRRPLTAGQFAQAIASANPGIRAGMMRITAKKGGWLDEIWLCLDKALRYRICPARQGGVAASSRLRIWRGRS